MNKRILILPLLLIMLFTFTACKKETEEKKPISGDSFKLVAEGDKYTTKDVTKNFKSDSGITEAIVAAVENQYQVEFYTLKDSKTAQKMYDRNKKRFENIKSSLDKAEVTETDNNSEYKISTNGRYMLLNKIDNTLIYANVEDKYKESVTTLIKQLGYSN